MILPFLFLVIQSFYNKRWINYLNLVYTFLILIIYFLITTSELGIYSDWKSKLSYKALAYLSHPDEVFNSVDTFRFVFLIALLLIQIFICFWIYRKYFYIFIIKIRKNLISGMLFFIILPPILFIGLRGGTKEIPICQGDAFYSRHEILNTLSINSAWNLIHNIINNYNNIGKNPYKSFDDKYALRVVESIYKAEKDTSIKILTNPRPNIVLFILEGWSADLIESLGGDKGITPFFHELEKNGILFTNMYSSGTRSQQGHAAILSAFPAFPSNTITNQPEKYKNLEYFTRDLIKQGYYTSYYFGGQLVYGNMKGYIYENLFDKIYEGKDFPSDIPRGKLGVQDNFTIPFFLNEINKNPQPFFSTLFTVSSHSPFDINQPFKKIYENENNYVNTVMYIDRWFKDFFENASKQPWYNNTLFILISDHSHTSYRDHDIYGPEYNKILMLITGNVIKNEYKGAQCKKIASQVDFAATVLAQLGLETKKYRWSKNLLNPYCPEFAYYSTYDAIGWIRPSGNFAYDKSINHYFFTNINDSTLISRDSLIIEGKSYLQCVFKDFLDK